MKHAFWVIALCCASACASSNQGEGVDASGTGSCQTTSDCVDDGEFCNGGVVCREGECLPTSPPECGDGIVCTVDSCSEAQLGCLNLPNDSLCDEGLACLDGEGCGTPPACEFSPDCNDDAFLCNGVPECVDSMCLSTPLDCVDTDVCTADSCVEGTGCVNDPYDFMADVNHCTSACIPCPLPTQAQVNVDRECDAGVCGFICQTGFWDVNNNMVDGCEVGCPTDPTTTVDVPDDGFLDQNCDGIDGTVGNGIFVSEDGSNANPGTMGFPVKTIGNGLTKAVAGGKTFLYISAGNYAETVTLDTSNDGIGLHGGYLRSSGWARDGTRGVITGPRTGALRINSIAVNTVVEYLHFVSASATVSATSSHAIVVSNSNGFRPRYLIATAGNGASGTQGASAGVAGDDGGNGVPGANGFEDDGYFYCAGNATDPATNYAGGDSCSGATSSTRGGDGRRGCITNGGDCAGTGGNNGTPNPAGLPSDGGGGVTGGVGNPGQNGQNGSSGTDPSGGSGGSISGTEWVPASGASGGRGVDGTGGGGGAGGGSTHSSGTCNDWGGGGGGGGGGGCGGTGGNGGTGGGGSIAILLINSSVTAEYVDVVTGNGGVGGAGRVGGGQGPRGDGAVAGNGNDESRAGGRGGNGGTGGRGGHGSGGAGGWVVGVYRSGSTWNDGSTTSASLGTVGNGGSSSGNGGTAGSGYDLY